MATAKKPAAKQPSPEKRDQYARILQAAQQARANQAGGTYAEKFKKVVRQRKVPKGSGM